MSSVSLCLTFIIYWRPARPNPLSAVRPLFLIRTTHTDPMRTADNVTNPSHPEPENTGGKKDPKRMNSEKDFLLPPPVLLVGCRYLIANFLFWVQPRVKIQLNWISLTIIRKEEAEGSLGSQRLNTLAVARRLPLAQPNDIVRRRSCTEGTQGLLSSYQLKMSISNFKLSPFLASQQQERMTTLKRYGQKMEENLKKKA